MNILGARHRKQVKQLINDYYWTGFFDALGGEEDEQCPWEYVSTGSLSKYNAIHYRAYALGVRQCLSHLQSRQPKRPWMSQATHSIPQSVYDECLNLDNTSS